MKYIIFEDFSGDTVPIIFPKRVHFEEMREQIPYSKVISAGRIDYVGGEFRCHGGSKALGVMAREEDREIIEKNFVPVE